MPTDPLAPVLSAVRRTVKPLGWQRSGSHFLRELPEVVLWFNYQKSRTSTAQEVRFTVNLGILLKRLRPLRGFPAARIVKAVDPQWHKRAGELLGVADLWWTIPRDDPAAAADLEREQLRLVTTVVIPELERYDNEAAIAALWAAGESPGLTESYANELLRMLRRAHRDSHL